MKIEILNKEATGIPYSDLEVGETFVLDQGSDRICCKTDIPFGRYQHMALRLADGTGTCVGDSNTIFPTPAKVVIEL